MVKTSQVKRLSKNLAGPLPVTQTENIESPMNISNYYPVKYK